MIRATLRASGRVDEQSISEPADVHAHRGEDAHEVTARDIRLRDEGGQHGGSVAAVS